MLSRQPQPAVLRAAVLALFVGGYMALSGLVRLLG